MNREQLVEGVKNFDAGEAAFMGSTELLPNYEELPDDFKCQNNDWTKLFSVWFFNGLPEGTEFVPKDDVDTSKALAVVKAHMSSFEPKHEHKTSGVAWMLSQLFEEVRVPGRGITS